MVCNLLVKVNYVGKAGRRNVCCLLKAVICDRGKCDQQCSNYDESMFIKGEWLLESRLVA